jgi:PhnB protein
MRFYEKALSGKLSQMMTHAQSPMGAQASRDNAGRIMHARIDFEGGVLMAADNLASDPKQPMSGFMISLVYGTNDEAKRVFDALAKGGKVIMPLEKTFWSEAFAMLTDRFGTPWMISGPMIPFQG